MRQYCRYCVSCINDNGLYCTNFNKTLTEAKIKHTNRCKDFALSRLGDVTTGRQYRPRTRKVRQEAEYQDLFSKKWKRYDFKPIHAVRSAFKKKVRRFPNGTPYTRQVNLRMCNRAFEELRQISNKKGVSMNIYLNDIIETAIKKEVEQNVQKQI